MRLIFLLSIFFLFFSANKAIAQKKKISKSLKKVIVLDAGHGGLDIGTKENKPYLEEKKAALTTAILAKKYLDQLGYKVILTRSTDAFIPLSQRVGTANKSSSNLFVSLHYNSSPNQTAHGIEIFFCPTKNGKIRASASKKLAAKVLDNVIKRTKAKSRGVKQASFYVIRETKMPAVLLEGGFISNPQERAKLKNVQYLEKIAKGVADGVDRYFKAT
jgi:N-acetylmuramoyl-L-alanine amidase